MSLSSPSSEQPERKLPGIDTAVLRMDAYVNGLSERFGYLPIRSEDRLRRFFGDGKPGDQIRVLKRAIPMMSDANQSALISYFSGLPASKLGAYGDGVVDESLEFLADLLVDVFDVTPRYNSLPGDSVDARVAGYERQVTALAARVVRETGVSYPPEGYDHTDHNEAGKYVAWSPEQIREYRYQQMLGQAALKTLQ